VVSGAGWAVCGRCKGEGLRQVQAAQGKSAAVAVAADASSAADCTFGRNPSARSSEVSGRKKLESQLRKPESKPFIILHYKR